MFDENYQTSTPANLMTVTSSFSRSLRNLATRQLAILAAIKAKREELVTEYLLLWLFVETKSLGDNNDSPLTVRDWRGGEAGPNEERTEPPQSPTPRGEL